MCAGAHACAYVCVRMCVHVGMCMCVHVCTCMCMCVRAGACVYVCGHVRTSVFWEGTDRRSGYYLFEIGWPLVGLTVLPLREGQLFFSNTCI